MKEAHLDVISCGLDIALGVLASRLGLSCGVVSSVLAAHATMKSEGLNDVQLH